MLKNIVGKLSELHIHHLLLVLTPCVSTCLSGIESAMAGIDRKCVVFTKKKLQQLEKKDTDELNVIVIWQKV